MTAKIDAQIAITMARLPRELLASGHGTHSPLTKLTYAPRAQPLQLGAEALAVPALLASITPVPALVANRHVEGGAPDPVVAAVGHASRGRETMTRS